MAIIGNVESKSFKGRLAHVIIILMLTLGGATMVYPFMIMISGSLRSEMDESNLDVVPRYMVNQAELYRKFLETKFNQDVATLNQSQLRHYFSFRDPQAPPPASEQRLEQLRQFMDPSNLPDHWQVLGGIRGVRTTPENLRDLRGRIQEQFHDDLNAFSRATGAATLRWLDLVMMPPEWVSRRYDPPTGPIYDAYLAMLRESDVAERSLVSVSGAFLQSIIYPRYGQASTGAYNADHTYPIEDFHQFRLPNRVPGDDQPTLRAQWIEFVQQDLNPAFVDIPQVPDADYQAYLSKSYQQIDALNRDWATSYTSFDQITLPRGKWMSGSQRQDYDRFLEQQPVEALCLVGPEYAWQKLIGSDEPIPAAALDYQYVQEHAGSLRWAYAVRNYINVWDELVGQGRVLTNTVIFCVLSITLALLINPLAAYGMSRFRLPGTYKFLLILMATMAFPPMVTLIPQFLMLRQLGLMNTLIALLLPMIANGYLIFLLKGFFDSLPQELYEAAVIDGASEMRMFFQITMALSKPILAVLALQTFTLAYTMFLYALLVSPDPDTWLITVWLYQYQQNASSSGVYASIIIASVPTLVIFLFVQRTIMRGIVVPTEK